MANVLSELPGLCSRVKKNIKYLAPNGDKGKGIYMAKKRWSMTEKLKHYTAVAAGEKEVKTKSKFSEAEQRSYARGQRDARNEERRLFKFKNSTEAERKAYRAQRKEQAAAFTAQKK